MPSARARTVRSTRFPPMPSLPSGARLVACALALVAVPLTSTEASAQTAQASAVSANPLLSPFETPFGVPPFGQIEDAHFVPAVEAGMREQIAEIERITADPAAPTFANTLEALERSGATLRRASGVFAALNSAHTNDTRQAIARELAPRLAAHGDAVYLDADLFARLEAVRNGPEYARLNDEERRLLDETHRRFVRGGVALRGEPQARLRAINGELAELGQRFAQNMLAETNGFLLLIENEADLEGLSPALVAAAAETAARRGHAGQWAFTLQNPSVFPFLSHSPRRALREQIFTAYALRGDNGNEHDNRAGVSRMAALRAERAALLGYPTHAHYVLEDAMAETPERVYAFLDQLWPAGLARANEEASELEALLRADGLDGPLQPWDWWYYAERVRQGRFNLDDAEVRPYFSLEAVRDGAFGLATRLFGLTFHERADLPVYHESVLAFEVREADGAPVGILYTDYYTRESKRGGAWMTSTVRQGRLDGAVLPVVYNVCNFPAPTAGQPSLLSFDEATTLFHEFGHGLHGLLSDVTFESLSGTSVPRDFVEFPSQILENWVGAPDFMKTFARHYETGETIPDALVERLVAAEQFNGGFRTTEYLAASFLDMAWHSLEEPTEHDARTFETAEMRRIGLPDAIIPRYRSPYFAHAFSGGYSAGYYSYIWAEVLDADGFAAFETQGLYNADLARTLRREVLSRGNTRPAMEQYRAFLGREPEVGPLLRRRGLQPAN